MVGAGGDQEVILAESPDEVTYIKFSFSDEVVAASVEAKRVWPLLCLAAMKPQDSRAKLPKPLLVNIACFLWPEQGIKSESSTCQRVSFVWANSLRLSWILSLCDAPKDNFNSIIGTGFWDERHEPSTGLWMQTNKDTDCLPEASNMCRRKVHEVVIALADCFQGPGRRWAAVWVDRKLCSERFRVHQGEVVWNLSRGGRDASIRVEWNGGRGEVADLCVHGGELISGVNPDEVQRVD